MTSHNTAALYLRRAEQGGVSWLPEHNLDRLQQLRWSTKSGPPVSILRLHATPGTPVRGYTQLSGRRATVLGRDPTSFSEHE